MGTRVAEPPSTDLELLDAYRRGHPSAFDRLYARHRDALFLHARALTRDDALAEDLVHETLLRLMKAGDARLAPSGSLGPFLHTTLRRLAIDQRRSRESAARRERTAGAWIRPAAPDLLPGQVDELDRALRTLPPEQLEAVLLRVYAGLTFQEIADATDVPLKTAVSRYSYALKKLGDMLA